MKKMVLRNWLATFLFAAVSCGFAACDDDKGGTPAPDNIQAVIGAYSGTMNVLEAQPLENGEDTTAGTALEASVSESKIEFNDFPIRDLVVKIVGEELADTIVATVGPIDYEVSYSAVMSEDNSSVRMTLSPQPLKITIEGNSTESVAEDGDQGSTSVEIEVGISALLEGLYGIESKKLGFNLSVDSVKLNGVDLPEFTAFTLGFDFTKK